MYYKLVENQYVELTEREIEEITNTQVAQKVTDNQRISALESAIADLAIMMAMGGSTDAWFYWNTS